MIYCLLELNSVVRLDGRKETLKLKLERFRDVIICLRCEDITEHSTDRNGSVQEKVMAFTNASDLMSDVLCL